jgi:hypothetical protein
LSVSHRFGRDRVKDNSIYLVIMKFIKNIIQKFIKEDKKILGRWNIAIKNEP